MTLVEFLKARLDEDERVAQAATLQRWRVDAWANDAGREFLVVANEEAGAPAFGIKSERDAEHIARHDPARVLAEVEAKRRILDGVQGAVSMVAVAGTVHVDDWVFRLLALPYADHPDYDEAWRPQA